MRRSIEILKILYVLLPYSYNFTVKKKKKNCRRNLEYDEPSAVTDDAISSSVHYTRLYFKRGRNKISTEAYKAKCQLLTS